MRNAILAIMVLAGFAGSRAEAQSSTTCAGRAVIDTIYATAMGGGRYEYFVQLRNSTAGRLSVELVASVFVATAPPLPVQLGPFAQVRQRIGASTNAQISPSTVAFLYDGARSSGMSVRASNCRAA